MDVILKVCLLGKDVSSRNENLAADQPDCFYSPRDLYVPIRFLSLWKIPLLSLTKPFRSNSDWLASSIPMMENIGFKAVKETQPGSVKNKLVQ